MGSIAGRVKIVLSFTASRSTLGSTNPPIKWVEGALFWGVKKQGRKADHSSPSNVKIKKGGAIRRFLYMYPWRSSYLIKYRGD
jgi:hypothetical protein